MCICLYSLLHRIYTLLYIGICICAYRMHYIARPGLRSVHMQEAVWRLSGGCPYSDILTRPGGPPYPSIAQSLFITKLYLCILYTYIIVIISYVFPFLFYLLRLLNVYYTKCVVYAIHTYNIRYIIRCLKLQDISMMKYTRSRDSYMT